MKTFICLLVVVAVFIFSGNVLGGDDGSLSLTAYYQAAIDNEINSCLEKQSLQNSRSVQLQRKGHLEASKAQFLMANREHLVAAMLKNAIGRKPHKVQRFLNDRFHCTCYAQWQAKSHF